MHIAAAAACRGSTANTKKPVHRVFPRVYGSSCYYTCAKTTNHKYCDAEVSFSASMGKAKARGEDVGAFYNYRCKGSGNWGDEVLAKESKLKNGRSLSANLVSYCCCASAESKLNFVFGKANGDVYIDSLIQDSMF